VDKKNTKEKWY